MGRGLPQPYPALETHPGRGSAFFIVLGNFCAFSYVFCVLVGCCTFLRVFAYFSALGVPLVALGTLLGALGTLLGRSWGALGRSWALLERSWTLLGRSWGALGQKYGKTTSAIQV